MINKRITVTLSEEAHKYFNEVAYGLDMGGGKLSTNSQIINYCLEALSLFEKEMEQDILSYLVEIKPSVYGK